MSISNIGYSNMVQTMQAAQAAKHKQKIATAHMMETMSNLAAAEKRFDAAHDLLKNQSTVNASKTAAIGYCFGGGVVLHAARTGRDLKGVVSYHGSLKPMAKAEKGKVKAQVRVFNGADDPFVKPEHTTAFKMEMQAAGVNWDFVNYQGAVHSFTNPDADAFAAKFNMPLGYDAAADADSWAQTRAFFQDIFR